MNWLKTLRIKSRNSFESVYIINEQVKVLPGGVEFRTANEQDVLKSSTSSTGNINQDGLCETPAPSYPVSP